VIVNAVYGHDAEIRERVYRAYERLLTLIALAYVVENIRGHYAWKNFERAAAAQGEQSAHS
jgi:hypothetical protein